LPIELTGDLRKRRQVTANTRPINRGFHAHSPASFLSAQPLWEAASRARASDRPVPEMASDDFTYTLHLRAARQ
jgi:hypothetical protein